MKHTILFFRLLSSIAFLAIAFSAHALDTSDFLVHMGVDLQGRRVPMQDNGGGTLVQKEYGQIGGYAGMRFFEDSLGFEAGYQRSNSMSRNRDISSDSSYFSSAVPVAGNYLSKTKNAMQNIYVMVVGLLPLSSMHHLKLIASVGAGRTRTRISADLSPIPTGTTTWPLRFMDMKWIPKANVGLQWMATEHLGLRALAGWEQMARFKRVRASTADSSTNSQYFASFKNTASASLGVFYSF